VYEGERKIILIKNKAMQKILSLLILMGFCTFLSAQIDITISGTVTNTDGDPVPNVMIFISTDSIGTSMYTNTLFTDDNGQYSDAFTVDDNQTQGMLFVSMADCNQFYINETLSWFPGNTDLVQDFTYCDPQTTCSASVSYDEDEMTLTAFAFGTAPYAYAWTFGETTSTISVDTYGTYCVTVTDAVGCVAEACYYVSATGDSTCYVSIGLLASGGLGISGYGQAPFTYQWSNGSTGSVIYPTADGTYCVTMTDGTGCNSEDCYYFSNSTDTLCYVSVYNTVFGSLDAYATGEAPFSYLWDTGETTSSIFPDEIGTYCVTITDALGCEAEGCGYYDIIGDTTCYVIIQEVQNGAGLYANAGSFPPYTYEWNTGDTDSYLDLNGQTGTFCVTVTDATGCTAEDCYIVAGPDNFQISGLVYVPDSINGGSLEGWAYLIVYDEVAGTLTAVDTVELDNTAVGFASYDFGDVAAGDYLVKVALSQDSPEYDNHLPTYYGDVLWWDEASTITVPYNGWWGFHVTLIEGDNPGGPGFIGGLVSEGANFHSGDIEERGEGDPIEGVSIILLDENEEPVTHTYTNSEGHYEFPSLAWGTYKVVIEMIGFEQEYYWVTLSPDNPSEEGINFEVNESGISSEISILRNDGEVLIFPNPANTIVNLQLDAKAIAEGQLMVTDFTGRMLQIQAIDIALGTQQFEIDVQHYPAGLYLLTLQVGNDVIAKKFVKE
jgi:hypothetical protein